MRDRSSTARTTTISIANRTTTRNIAAQRRKRITVSRRPKRKRTSLKVSSTQNRKARMKWTTLISARKCRRKSLKAREPAKLKMSSKETMPDRAKANGDS